MKKTTDIPATQRSGEKGVAVGMAMAVLLTLLAHSTFLLFKKAPLKVTMKSAPQPMVALLPMNTKSKTEIGLLKWMDVLDPECFIKPDRRRGFSLSLEDDSISDAPFTEKPRTSTFHLPPLPPLPTPTETEQERLRKLWSYTPLPISPAEPRVAIPATEYPLWLLGDNSRLPQLFPAPAELRTLVKKSTLTSSETVLKARFFDGDFFPDVLLDHSCGNPALDAAAIKTLTFRGSTLSLHSKKYGCPVFISIKWKP